MQKFIYLSAGILLVAACQNAGYSRHAYQKKLENTVGKSAAYLYGAWGQPQQIIPVADNTYLAVYYSAENQPVDNDYQPYAGELSYAAMAVPNYGLPLPPPLFYCKTTFVIRNNIITDFNFNGDDCY